MKSAISSLTSGIMHQVSYRLSRKGSHYLVSASLDVKSAQKHILTKILDDISGSENAKQHGLSANSSLQEYQQKVPITDYEYWQASIHKQQENNETILTKYPCQRYQPTSGSTSKI